MGKQKQNKISNETNHKYQNINQKVNRWLVGPAGPHFAILGGCPEYVRSAICPNSRRQAFHSQAEQSDSFTAKDCQSGPTLSIITRITSAAAAAKHRSHSEHERFSPVRQWATRPCRQSPGKNRGLLLVCLRFLQLERTS